MKTTKSQTKVYTTEYLTSIKPSGSAVHYYEELLSTMDAAEPNLWAPLNHEYQQTILIYSVRWILILAQFESCNIK